jgi:hypothetical protein
VAAEHIALVTKRRRVPKKIHRLTLAEKALLARGFAAGIPSDELCRAFSVSERALRHAVTTIYKRIQTGLPVPELGVTTARALREPPPSFPAAGNGHGVGHE